MAKLGRPTKPLISKDNAIRVALEIIDEQGLEALSLERVAKGIGVRAPSLYHHFHNKAELLLEIARSILRKIEMPDNPDVPWEEQLLELCLATRRAILRHPRAGLLMLQYFPRTLLLSAYDVWAAKCPYPVEVQMLVLDGVEKITFGSAFFAAASAAYAVPTMPEFNADEFPALAVAVESNPHDDEELFAQTVEIFLAGLKAKFDNRRPAKKSLPVKSTTPTARAKPSPKPKAATKLAKTAVAKTKARAVKKA